MNKRIGQFSISRSEINVNPGQIRGIMQHCIIVRAEAMYLNDTIHYMALSPKFNEVEENCAAPEYTWNFQDGEWCAELLEGE